MRQAWQEVVRPLHVEYGLRHQSPAGETIRQGFLVSAEQKLVSVQTQLSNSARAVGYIAVSSYRWAPRRPPVPQTHRRMLGCNAIEAWDMMLKTDWRLCSPPGC